MKSKAWSNSGDKYYPIVTSSFQENLDAGVYTIQIPDMSPMFFQKIKEDFTFSYKIYGHNNKLVDRVCKTYENTKDNLGVLLNGYKGTGKSVTAELICNKMSKEKNMPVILINEQIHGLPEILANIHQDVIVFVDEFEKVFSRDVQDYTIDTSQELLTVMDGALKSEYRRLFVFTTNKTHINENLLQRPGRIRYLVQFKDLSKKVIEEIVDDMLEYPEHRDSTIEFIAGLEMITVDIVKAVINEVNLFNESPEDFKHIFNVEEKSAVYNIYKGDIDADDSDPKILFDRVDVSPNPEIMKASPLKYAGKSLYIEHAYVGRILEVKDKVVVYQLDGGKKQTVTLEKTKSYHHNYSMVF